MQIRDISFLHMTSTQSFYGNSLKEKKIDLPLLLLLLSPVNLTGDYSIGINQSQLSLIRMDQSQLTFN